jgi:hypothetical protein
MLGRWTHGFSLNDGTDRWDLIDRSESLAGEQGRNHGFVDPVDRVGPVGAWITAHVVEACRLRKVQISIEVGCEAPRIGLFDVTH